MPFRFDYFGRFSFVILSVGVVACSAGESTSAGGSSGGASTGGKTGGEAASSSLGATAGTGPAGGTDSAGTASHLGGSTGGTPPDDSGGSSSGGSATGGQEPQQGGASFAGGASPTGGASSAGGTGGVQIPSSATGFLHVEGNQLVDSEGRAARLTGVNWFGFETQNLSPHGLWARDYRSMLRQIADLGFNTVRIPWCNAMLRDGAEPVSINTDGADPYDGTDPMNAPLVGLSPVEILDLLIETAGELGLKVMLDNHSREPDGYMEEKVWYTESTPEEQWIEDWRFLAGRYRSNPTVVAFDLNNEPHGESTWGVGDPATDWNAAAERCGNAVLEVNPDVLIVVEGVEKVGEDGYWWGGNLSGVRDYPIALTDPSKLVYSAHEYGPEVHVQPWFEAPDFPNNLESIWDDHFGFIMNAASGHVFIGEFGIKDPDASEGKSMVWFETFLEYMGPTYSWTFWCWNPNSGDTEGILEYDWLTPKQWKLDAIAPYLAPFIG